MAERRTTSASAGTIDASDSASRTTTTKYSTKSVMIRS